MTSDIEDLTKTSVCKGCSAVMKSGSFKSCYPCHYLMKHGHEIPENTCLCGVTCKTFKRCYKCHMETISLQGVHVQVDDNII